MVKLEITRRAERQIETALAWWAENRLDAPDMLERAIEAALVQIRHFPGIGVATQKARIKGTRAVLIARGRYRLYYRERPNKVQVVALWSTQRGTGPDV